MKIAFFDFCKTIVNVNSLNLYVYYVLKRQISLINYFKRALFAERNLISKLLNTKPRYLEIFLLKGYSIYYLENLAFHFFNELLVPSFNEKVIKRLIDLKKSGFYIIVISAALDIYLKYLSKFIPVDLVICAELEFKNKVCSGKIKGIDPFGKGKLEKFKKLFPDYNKINWQESYFFTDDWINDKYILEKVGNPVLVVDERTKLDFSLINNYKEVIYI